MLVDATFLNPATRTQFIALAQALQVPCRILAFEAPLAVLPRARCRRATARAKMRPEADVAVLDSQWATRNPLAPDELALTVHVDTPAGGLGCIAAPKPLTWMRAFSRQLPRHEVQQHARHDQVAKNLPTCHVGHAGPERQLSHPATATAGHPHRAASSAGRAGQSGATTSPVRALRWDCPRAHPRSCGRPGPSTSSPHRPGCCHGGHTNRGPERSGVEL